MPACPRPHGAVTRPLLLLLLAACTSERGTLEPVPTPPPPPPVVASIRVLPGEADLEPGATMPFRAEALDAAGRALGDRPITWQSSAPAVATVSASGEVTAVGDGIATIVASSGAVSQGARVRVARPAPVVAVVELSQRVLTLEPGASLRLLATVRDARGHVLPGRLVRWTSTHPTIARVDAAGQVVAVAPGQATVTADADGVHAQATVLVQAATQQWTLGELPAHTPRDEWRVLTRVRHTPPDAPAYTEVRVVERGTIRVMGTRWVQELDVAVWHDLETPLGGVTHRLVRREVLADRGPIYYDWMSGDLQLQSELVPSRLLRTVLGPEGLLVAQPVAVPPGVRHDLYRR
jgi:hypothetical protein